MFVKEMYELGSTKNSIMELFEYGLEKAAVVGRENIYDFCIGNPSIPAPAGLNEAMISVLKEMDSLSVHGYTPAAGLVETRKAIADDLNERYGTSLRYDNFYITCGAAPAFCAAVSALAVENAEIIVIAPFFNEYRPYIEKNGCKLQMVPADTENFQIRFDDLESLLNKNTQAVVVNSPNNPSGVVYTRETLEKLAELLTRKSEEVGHPIYIIADEPYRELVYDGVEVPFIPTIYPNTIVCYSYSKCLSMPGERLGYACVPDQAADSADLYKAIAGAARVTGHICAPSLQQLAIARCAHLRPDLEMYDRNRKVMYEALTSYGYESTRPTGAFYLFVKAPNGNAKEFSEMAKKENLLVVPGDDFGCPSFFRASTCVNPDMVDRSLPIFKKLIDQING